MRILILNCDFDPNIETNGAMLLRKYLSDMNVNDILIKDVFENDFPNEDELKSSDRIIITGSRSSVYEELDWIKQLMRIIALIDKLEIPTLGICFGYQIIAEALTGKVKPGKNIEEGFSKIFINENGLRNAIFYGFEQELLVYQSHKDVVIELPEGAVILAENDYGLQAFCLRNFFCVQFHPEILTQTAKKMAIRDNKDLDMVLNCVDSNYRKTLCILKNFVDCCNFQE